MSSSRRTALFDPGNVRVRDATHDDLAALLRLTLAGLDLHEVVDRVTDGDIHSFHTHALQHGRILVAAAGDLIAGYASTIERDGYRILCQVFVRDELQSFGVGRLLVDKIDTFGDTDRLLVASADARATSLYVRRGFVPAWPIYTLKLDVDALARLPESTAKSRTAEIDVELIELDTRISGRSRRDDLLFWTRETGGTPYLHRHLDDICGFGWIHDPLSGTMNMWFESDDPLHIGPVGALSALDARECVLATLTFAQQAFPGRGASIEIGGPHPALPVLLQAGARIVDAETFMATDAGRFGNPETYVPSGGVLF